MKHSKQTQHSQHSICGVNKKTRQRDNVNDIDVVQMQHNTTQQTGNKIGAEGARLMSEALKTNTTLTTLNLCGEQENRQRGKENGMMLFKCKHNNTTNRQLDWSRRSRFDE